MKLCEPRKSTIALALATVLAGTAPALAQITVIGDVSPAGIGPGSTDIGNSTNLLVGNTSAGSMSVVGGATFSGRAFFLGETSTGNGNLTVSGAGSSATANTGIGVGRNGIGVLNIQSGATVTSQGASGFSVIVAEFAGSSGTLTVDGGTLNTSLNDTTPLLGVGYRGTGALNVLNGGGVTIGSASAGVGLENGGSLQIGSANFSGTVTPASGSVLVSGTGSVIELMGQNQSLNVGRMGGGTTGSLTVQNGGEVRAGTFLGIGRGRESGGVTEVGLGATGTVVVEGAGSKLTVAGIRTCCTDTGNGPDMQIGAQDGTGTLTIRNSGFVQLDARGMTGSESGGVSVARNALSTGTLTIETGARLELLSDSPTDSFGMTIGRLGTGSLNVADGGQIFISNTGAGGVGLTFGGNSASGTGGSFAGLIAGAGTAVTITGIDASMTVGSRSGSSGTVTIEAEAAVAPGHRLLVGANPGSSGTLQIRGAGTIISMKSLAGDEFGAGMTVGRSGIGVATISDGAVVNVDGTGGAQRHSTNVGGSGVDSGGTGTLNIMGATTRYNVTGASTSLVIGRDDTGTTPSTGTMTIADGAQVSFPGAGVGSVGYSPGSTGTLNVIGAGSRLNMGAFLGVGRNINDQPGGTGTLNVASGGVVQAVSIHVGSSGTLIGDGTLDGSVINDGAIFPGNSPGVLQITGDL
ncbi:MAG: hypothetical protein EHM59_15815, partial [Betaproteobacteria bacterium]